MNNAPLITTIIPTFERPAQLKRAILSVLRQTFPHIEICVYDNASKDETQAMVTVLGKADARIKYFRHPENIGAANNFEFGLQKVETPYFSFLSDDDILLPEFYENALEGFKQYPEAGFSAGAVVDMREEGTFLALSSATSQEREFFAGTEGLYKMITHYVNWTGTLFRREVIHEIHGIDKRVKALDVDFVLRVAARFPYVHSRDPYAIFIQHAASFSGNCGIKLVYPSWDKIIENLQNSNCLSEAEKQTANTLLKLKRRDLLISIAQRNIERTSLNEMLLISNLLKESQGKSLKKKIIHIAALLSTKPRFLQKIFCILTSFCYQMMVLVKKYPIQREYRDLIEKARKSL